MEKITMWVLRVITVVALLWSAVSHAGSRVVIASDIPILERGALVADDHRFEIPAGKSVTLISTEGAIIRLSGPYDGVVSTSSSTADGDLLNALSQLIAEDTVPQVALAVTRGLHPPGRPDLWGIDITRSGKRCVRQDRPVMLWRWSARSKARIELKAATTGAQSVYIDWPGKLRAVPWPSDLSLTDNVAYVARIDKKKAKQLTVVLIPPLPTDAHRATWMHEHGCSRQAFDVLDAMAKGEL